MSRKKNRQKKIAAPLDTLPVPCYIDTMNATERDEKEARRERYLLTRGRDWYIVQLIQGATKAGVQPDRRKEKNKRACRKKVDRESGE